jgi:hypothetical protein
MISASWPRYQKARVGMDSDKTKCALKQVIDLATQNDKITQDEALETLGATHITDKELTLNQLRSLMQNVLDSIHLEMSGNFNSKNTEIISDQLKH